MDEEFLRSFNNIKNTKNIIDAVIQDLQFSSKALEEYLSYFEDPVKMFMSNNLEKDMKAKVSSFSLGLLMASNKMESLIGSLDTENKED